MSFFVPTETTSHWHSELGMHSSRGPALQGPALQASSMTNNIEVCVKINISLLYPSTWKYPPWSSSPLLHFLPSVCMLQVCSRMLTTSGIDRSIPYHTVSNQIPKSSHSEVYPRSLARDDPLPHSPICTHGCVGTRFRSARVLIMVDAGRKWVLDVGSYPLCPCCPRCVY